MTLTARRIAIITIAAGAAVGCATNTALERLSEARHMSADLLVHFTKAGEAGVYRDAISAQAGQSILPRAEALGIESPDVPSRPGDGPRS